ncbi:MAG TPA: hypothetical protein VLF69_05275 [Candidatus Saccharimonadales bacterium]|nr:hypothetical protein [Candidatus Saccharimonadales bacterium]
MATKNQERKIIDKVFVLLGVAVMLVLLVAGSLGWYAHNFAINMVHTELAAQKIYFPPKGSPALDPAEFPDLQQYAGQQVDNGLKAKAYANGFIARHLEKIAAGKTYSEVSAEAMADPTNTTLQMQKAVLFQGETLRGLLLGDGYGYWMFGEIAGYAALAALVGSVVMFGLVLLGLRHIARLK